MTHTLKLALAALLIALGPQAARADAAANFPASPSASSHRSRPAAAPTC
jgi:hypothetical protein